MGMDDKLENKFEETGGKLKEGVGQATGDEQLQAEGKADQVKAAAKQAGEKLKDAGEKAGEKLKEAGEKAKEAAAQVVDSAKNLAPKK